MGHHHREDPIIPLQPKDNQDNAETKNNPFLAASDITYLSIILPLLSEPGKQLISFFVNFGNNKPSSPSLNDPLGILKQLAPKIENSGLREILPSILTMLTNQDTKSSANPLSSITPMSNVKKEKEEGEEEGLK